MEVVLPSREKLRSDAAEPRRVKSSMDGGDPRWEIPYRLILLPKRVTLRKERALPKCTKSKPERGDP